MSETTKAPTHEEHYAHLHEHDSLGAWVARLAKGIMVGIGFILPGLSGGVLAVIFRIYDPIIRFLSRPFHKFWKQVRYFLPVAIGGAIGILLFSIVVDAAFGRFEPQFICLFIGFVIGTFPSLFRAAGRQGRRPLHWGIMLVSAIAIFVVMLVGGSIALNVAPSILAWLGSGALIGLGVIVPGMSPSNFLIYFGLYDKMAAGIAALDLTVIIPLVVGLAVCVLLFAKAAAWAFDRHYAGMYHFILGMVVGSSLAIFPTVVIPAFGDEGLADMRLSLWPAIAFAVALLVVGIIASWLFSKLEDRVEGQMGEDEAPLEVAAE